MENINRNAVIECIKECLESASEQIEAGKILAACEQAADADLVEALEMLLAYLQERELSMILRVKRIQGLISHMPIA